MSGAGEVIITDLLDHKLKKAEELGADRIINPQCRDVVKSVQQEYGRDGIDLIYDCVGTEETLSQAIQIARKGIKIMMVGMPRGQIRVDLLFVQDRELEIV